MAPLKKPHIRKVNGLWFVYARRGSTRPFDVCRSMQTAFLKAWRFRHHFDEFRGTRRRLP